MVKRSKGLLKNKGRFIVEIFLEQKGLKTEDQA
jgi:hypothetical protein